MSATGRRRLRSLLLFFPILLLITLLSFAVVYFSPGDAGRMLLKDHLQRPAVTEEEGKIYEERLGIDGSFGELYGKWLSRIVRGDFGTSLSTGREVSEYFWAKFKITLMLALLSLAVEVLVAFPISLRAGMKPGGFSDGLVSLWSVISFAIPSFWIGLICLWVLAMKLHLPGVIGYSGFFSLLIPALIMGLISCGYLSRIIRGRTREVMSCEFVEFATSQGLKESHILYYHVLPHVLASSLSVLILDISGLIGGAVLLEAIFNIPGSSGMLFQAIKVKDYTLISGSIFFISGLICFFNLLADMVYPKLDARNNNELLLSSKKRGGARLG